MWRFGQSENDKDKIISFIDYIVSKQLYLEYLYFAIDCKLFHFMMQQIEAKIFEFKNRRRKSRNLHFELIGSGWNDNKEGMEMMNNAQSQTFRLLNAIEMTDIDDFRLVIEIVSDYKVALDENTKSIKEWIETFQSLQDKYLIHYSFIAGGCSSSFKLIISKKGCKINGYSHSMNFT